jgi:hypothetical protein
MMKKFDQAIKLGAYPQAIDTNRHLVALNTSHDPMHSV